MDISVIIPVFNSQDYLKRCLDSIFTQEFEGTFEVIMINDGSTDGSIGILKEYEIIYDNLKILDFNGNFSNAVARRKGMEVAEGDYIICVDSDDLLKQGTLQKLLNYKEGFGEPDVLIYDYERHNGQVPISSNINIKQIKIYDESCKGEIQNLFMGACWNKMVKRSLLDDLIFGTFYMNNTEDLIYAFEVFLKAKKIITIPEAYYYYYVNPLSLSNNVNIVQHIKIQVIVFNTLSKIRKKYGDSLYFEPIFDYLKIGLIQSFFLNHIKNQLDDKLIQEFLVEYIGNVNEDRFLYVKKIIESFSFSCKEMLKFFGVINLCKIFFKNIRNEN